MECVGLCHFCNSFLSIKIQFDTNTECTWVTLVQCRVTWASQEVLVMWPFCPLGLFSSPSWNGDFRTPPTNRCFHSEETFRTLIVQYGRHLSHVLWGTWNVASTRKESNFTFYFILIELNLNSHMRLLAARFDVTVGEAETPSGGPCSAVNPADGGLCCCSCTPSAWKPSRFLGAWSVADTFFTLVCFDL